jgi:UDP-N-acetylmuramoyl-L-alanyl-D-glutamate--2,6-diaminopimelate ligase
MVNLTEIISAIDAIQVLGHTNKNIEMAHTNSKLVESNDLFIAIKGNTVDAHDFIESTIESGATAIICETLPTNLNPNICYIQVADPAAAAGRAIKTCYNNPDCQLKLIGVTGTNGKTTISTLLFSLFQNLGFKVGLLSTVENKINNKVIPSTHTTPEVSELYKLISQMVEEGVEYCFMEVSSHAIAQKRIAGLEFAGAIFSNLSHDHLDYHKSFAEYRDCKKELFDNLAKSSFAVTNKDDKNGAFMLQNTKAKKYFYGLKSICDFSTKIIETDFNGMEIEIDGQRFITTLVGEFNAFNLAAVYGAATLLNVDKNTLAIELSRLGKVKGRFEQINVISDNPIIVDYAHTPDALENVLTTINKIRKNNVKLTVVFGCGGNRDKTKRPEMGNIASRLANKVILTNDNPRNENPSDILNEIEQGIEGQYFKKIIRIEDRQQAIKNAIVSAEPGEVILIAGKGHENYQEINGVKHPFDDTQVALNILKNIL